MSTLFTRNRLIGLALAAMIALVDQIVKTWLIFSLELRLVEKIEVLPFFDLRYVENRGVSLGLLEASNMEMRWLLVAFTSVIAVVVFVWIMRERLLGDILGLALILGGAIGNIRDRFLYGYVIDYADLHFEFGETLIRPFLVFNIADAAITIGVVLILARALFVGEKGHDDATGVLEN